MRTTTVRNVKQIVRLLSCFAVLLLSANFAQAQQDQEATGLCFPNGKNTVVVRGVIGGESHESYVLHLIAGRKLTVRISSPRNRAQFSVRTSEFGEVVNFGTESNRGNTWTGTIPQTGVYFISVVAYPTSNYTLRVTKQ